MSFASLSLGERIVLAARMATQVHREMTREEENRIGRRVMSGGAGFQRVTEDDAPLEFAEGEVE